MNLRVSPRRRWLWLGTWKGEALRLWGLSRRGWGGRGRSLTSSRTRAYEILFSTRRRDSPCAAACTRDQFRTFVPPPAAT